MKINSNDLPRTRLERLGPGALSDAELLTVLICHTGDLDALETSHRLLREGGLRGLRCSPLYELTRAPGVGPVGAARFQAAVELGRRLSTVSVHERPNICSPADGANLVMYEMSALEQEEMWALILDNRRRLMSIEHIFKGGINSSQVQVGIVFRAAIRKNAPALIIVHNHPSGDPTPSPDDVAVTRAIVQGGKLLDVEVLDHLIIGGARYVSLKERGLGFE